MGEIVITGIGFMGAGASFLSSLGTAGSGALSEPFDPEGVQKLPQGFRPLQHIKANIGRKFSRMAQLAGSAMSLALTDACFSLDRIDPERCVVVCATTNGCIGFSEEFYRCVLENGPGAASPFLFCGGVLNASAGCASLSFRFPGQTTALVGTHAAGLEAALVGRDLIQAGEADSVICIAGEEITEATLAAYAKFGFLAPGEGPCQSALPLEGGTVLREGGTAILFEDSHESEKREARPYAAIEGYGQFVGSEMRLDPNGKGLELAVLQALTEANVDPTAITAIVPSANGTSVDRLEENAFSRVFGQNRPDLLKIRNFTGEGFSSTSLLELAAGASLARQRASRGMDRIAVLVTGVGDGIYSAAVLTGVDRSNG